MKNNSAKLMIILTSLAIICSLSFETARNTNASTTINYGNLTLSSPYTATHWNDVWDLTTSDLTLSYTIDMTGITQVVPFLGWWDTPWIEVGIRLEGAADFNPGIFGIYQGGCGGWMVSAVSDLGNEQPTPEPILDLDDTHGLQCSGGRSSLDYDCLDPNTVVAPFGTYDNYGFWYDRDGVDQWQATYWGSLNGKTYNTGGIYQIEIHYHAINSGLGSMFATINGVVQQGFYTAGWKNAQPEKYPAGISFKGDMSRMQVFAGISGDTSLPNGGNFGSAVLHDLTATGTLGASNLLIPSFTYSPPVVTVSTTVQFTDNTHGGSTPYAWWQWDFDGDDVTDSTDQNPTWQFPAPGDYNVKLTVKGYYGCETASVTKTIHVYLTPPVGGEWVPISKAKLLTAWISLASTTIALTGLFIYIRRKKKQE